MNKFKSSLMKILLPVLLASPLIASAHCLNQERLTGVNMSGAEFNSSKLPGTPYKDYTFPTEAELTYVAAKGANVIRLPFRWERVQPTAMGPLASAELKRIQGTVASAYSKGLCVILDVHNYAKYYSQTLNGDAALQNAFVDLWLRLALVFNDPKQTAFGLMNEPSYLPREEWASLAKRTLKELRYAGSTNMVFLAGGHWSGLHDWFSPSAGMSNAKLFGDIKDPLKRTILEVHQYADKDFSGSGNTCRAANEFNAFFTRVTEWAKANDQKMFLGEFGMPQNAECLLALERFLSLMTEPEWKGWTYWAAGGWWGKYPLAVNTDMAAPSQQWAIMQKYFYHGIPAEKTPPLGPLPRNRKN
jgi:endoglucanase